MSWIEVKKIIDKVHKHVCGHARLNDMQILVERNAMWNPEVRKYLSRVIEPCIHCAKAYEPKQTRNVSLSSLNRFFNDLECIDHFNLGDQRICHIILASTRYSVANAVPNVSMESAVNALDSLWIFQFWSPKAIQFDQAFHNEIFLKRLDTYAIEARNISAHRHNKNFLESNYKIIRKIFLRLKSEYGNISDTLAAQQSIRISNDLLCSSYEHAKDFIRLVEAGKIPKTIQQDILKAQDTLLAKRKHSFILRSKAVEDSPAEIYDLVQVLIKLQNEKRGSWTKAEPIFPYDKSLAIVTVPGKNGKKINVSVEDVRLL